MNFSFDIRMWATGTRKLPAKASTNLVRVLVEKLHLCREQLKGFPVEGRDSELTDSVAMGFGRITHIGFPTVTGILRREVRHQIVAVRLGQNRCCRDRKKFAVSLYNAFMLNSFVRCEPVTIDKQKGGRYFQLYNRFVHGKE